MQIVLITALLLTPPTELSWETLTTVRKVQAVLFFDRGHTVGKLHRRSSISLCSTKLFLKDVSAQFQTLQVHPLGGLLCVQKLQLHTELHLLEVRGLIYNVASYKLT